MKFVCFCLLAALLNNIMWKFNSKNWIRLQRLYSKGSGHWKGFSCSLVTDSGKPMFSIKYLPHLRLSLFEASMKLNHIPNLLPPTPILHNNLWTCCPGWVPLLGACPEARQVEGCFSLGVLCPRCSSYSPYLSLWFAILHFQELRLLVLHCPLPLMTSRSSCQALGRSAACFLLLLHVYDIQRVFSLCLPSSSEVEGSCGATVNLHLVNSCKFQVHNNKLTQINSARLSVSWGSSGISTLQVTLTMSHQQSYNLLLQSWRSFGNSSNL